MVRGEKQKHNVEKLLLMICAAGPVLARRSQTMTSTGNELLILDGAGRSQFGSGVEMVVQFRSGKSCFVIPSYKLN